MDDLWRYILVHQLLVLSLVGHLDLNVLLVSLQYSYIVQLQLTYHQNTLHYQQPRQSRVDTDVNSQLQLESQQLQPSPDLLLVNERHPFPTIKLQLLECLLDCLQPQVLRHPQFWHRPPHLNCHLEISLQ